MGTRLFLLAMLLCPWGLSACQVDTENPEVGQSQQGPLKRSEVLSDLTQITAALQSYYMQEGKFPERLDQLDLELYHPQDLNYTPETGKIRSKTFPDL